MARALELVISGLALGGIYALLAFALSLTINTTRILNVAHGVFFVWGGAFFVLFSQHLKLHPALAILILTACFFAFALVFQWGIVRPCSGGACTCCSSAVSWQPLGWACRWRARSAMPG